MNVNKQKEYNWIDKIGAGIVIILTIRLIYHIVIISIKLMHLL